MPAVLTLGSAQKAAGDRIRVSLDWGDEPSLIGLLTDVEGDFNYQAAAAISAYNTSTSGVGAPTVLLQQLDFPYQQSALLVGGSVGTYDILFSATIADADGTILSRTGTLEVL